MQKRPPINVNDVAILSSGIQQVFVEGEKKSLLEPMPALAYRGNEPVKDIRNLPSGKLFPFEYGLAFLEVPQKSGMSKGEVATTIGARLASRVIPFGGLLVRGTAAAASAARRQERGEKLIEEALQSPNTFIMPYWQISKVSIDEIGGLLSKRRYLVIEREQDGTKETFYVLLEGASRAVLEAYGDLIWALRPLGLVEPLAISAVRKIVDVAAIESDESLGGDASKMAEILDQELAKQGKRLMDIQMDFLYEYRDLFQPPMDEGTGEAICWNLRCQNQEPLDVGGHCPDCGSYIEPHDAEEEEGIRILKDPDHAIQRMSLEYPLYLFRGGGSRPDGIAEMDLHDVVKDLMFKEQKEYQDLQMATVLYRDMFDYVVVNRLSGFSPTLHRDIQQAISDGLLEPVQGDALGRYLATERLKAMEFEYFG